MNNLVCEGSTRALTEVVHASIVDGIITAFGNVRWVDAIPSRTFATD